MTAGSAGVQRCKPCYWLSEAPPPDLSACSDTPEARSETANHNTRGFQTANHNHRTNMMLFTDDDVTSARCVFFLWMSVFVWCDRCKWDDQILITAETISHLIVSSINSIDSFVPVSKLFFFSLFYSTVTEPLWVLSCWSNKTRDLKMSPLTLGNWNGHFSLLSDIWLIIFDLIS